jgi:hypothetical protein
MQDSKKGFLPMSHGITLSKKQCPTDPDEQERMRVIPYALAIGSIMYAMICMCPDVSYALSATRRYQSNYVEEPRKHSLCLEVKKSSLERVRVMLASKQMWMILNCNLVSCSASMEGR